VVSKYSFHRPQDCATLASISGAKLWHCELFCDGLTRSVEVAPEGGISPQKVEEAKVALQELGLTDEVSSDE
jgi:hypothetical protein